MSCFALRDEKIDSRPKRWRPAVFLLGYVTVSLQACLGNVWLGTSDGASPVSYQLYLSRVRNSRVQFEQYRSVPGGVFVECGSVVQGKGQPQEQGISPVSIEHEDLIREKALEVMEQSASGSVFTFDPPSGLDQAVLSLKVDARVVEIRTSVDSLARAETESAVALKELLEVIRGLPKQAPCKLEKFAAIARQVP